MERVAAQPRPEIEPDVVAERLETTSRHVANKLESKRVLFVCSAGGHLSQLLQLKPWWEQHERRWVTSDASDARAKLRDEVLVPAHFPTTRNLKNLARNMPLAFQCLRDWRPDVVVSNGAGVAVPFFLAAKVLRVPTVYIEVYDRIDSKTLTGKLVHPLADLFLTQWPEQNKMYRGSELIGPLY